MTLKNLFKMVKPEHVYWLIMALKLIQNVMVTILDYAIGYKTATGWKNKREKAVYDYETSAQIVRISCTF